MNKNFIILLCILHYIILIIIYLLVRINKGLWRVEAYIRKANLSLWVYVAECVSVLENECNELSRVWMWKQVKEPLPSFDIFLCRSSLRKREFIKQNFMELLFDFIINWSESKHCFKTVRLGDLATFLSANSLR